MVFWCFAPKSAQRRRVFDPLYPECIEGTLFRMWYDVETLRKSWRVCCSYKYRSTMIIPWHVMARMKTFHTTHMRMRMLPFIAMIALIYLIYRCFTCQQKSELFESSTKITFVSDILRCERHQGHTVLLKAAPPYSRCSTAWQRNARGHTVGLVSMPRKMTWRSHCAAISLHLVLSRVSITRVALEVSLYILLYCDWRICLCRIATMHTTSSRATSIRHNRQLRSYSDMKSQILG